MIRVGYEQIVENDKIRMEIIKMVTRILDTESLKILLGMSKLMDQKESKERPMDIWQLASRMDIRDMARVLDALDKAEPGQIAVEQIQEAFTIVFDEFTGATEDE